MSMYAFKEETITALGDAVRSKVGETRPITINNITISNLTMENIAIDDLKLDGSHYRYYYMTDIELPESEYYLLNTSGFNGPTNSSSLTLKFTSATTNTSAYLNVYPGATGTQKMMRYNIGQRPLLTIYLSIRKEDYENGLRASIESAIITAHDSNGTQLEWTTTEKNTMTVAQMADKIAALPPAPTESELIITGDCQYKFASNGWNWVIEKYGDVIKTENITNCTNMFLGCSELTEIPFEINLKQNHSNPISLSYMFSNCSKLKSTPAIDYGTPKTYSKVDSMFSSCSELTSIGKLSGFYSTDTGSIFANCYKLRELPVIENWNYERLHSYSSSGMKAMFQCCYSLRSIPTEFLKELYHPSTSYYYANTYQTFKWCHVLDEIVGLRGSTGTCTSNMFGDCFHYCYRLKRIIFDTQPGGVVYQHNWKNQIIDLTYSCGHVNDRLSTDTTNNWATKKELGITSYNSGITDDKRVYNDETYQALKNDPDWFAMTRDYSRYNKISAVETINSLPDCSASGGTNTIKFNGDAGSRTDGGAINTMTDTEIAVAAAKGWTVTFI